LAKVIEYVEAGYEVEEVEMGTVYMWCPESVVIECECGQSFTVEGTAKAASCPRCDAEHRGVLRGWLASH
jgi:Zn finger protein HypA/HybF involved in hydrogenase expression